MAGWRRSSAQRCFGHLDLAHLILFQISDFVLRIFREKRSMHPYGVLLQNPVLWAVILYSSEVVYPALRVHFTTSVENTPVWR